MPKRINRLGRDSRLHISLITYLPDSYISTTLTILFIIMDCYILGLSLPFKKVNEMLIFNLQYILYSL